MVALAGSAGDSDFWYFDPLCPAIRRSPIYLHALLSDIAFRDEELV